jgi:Tfp pilus assembly protein PilF
LQPYNPDAWLAIGLNLKYKGDTLQAIAGFRKAVEQDPELYDAHLQLALLFSAIGNDQAITYFDNALSIDPASQEARYGKGLFLQRKNRYEEAKSLYRDMVITDPQAREALYNLGVVYISQDSLAKAWQFFDMAIKVSPDYVDAYYGRGTVSEMQGEKEAAISDFRNCLQLNPDYAKAEEALQELFESENPS